MYSLGRKGVVPNRFVDTLARGPGGSGQTSGGRDFRPDAHPLMDVLGRRDVHISSPPAEPRRTPEMYAFLLSTVVIFVAELGDKSQLMAMTFATRYRARRSEEHTSELQSLIRISYAVFCLKNKT